MFVTLLYPHNPKSKSPVQNPSFLESMTGMSELEHEIPTFRVLLKTPDKLLLNAFALYYILLLKTMLVGRAINARLLMLHRRNKYTI